MKISTKVMPIFWAALLLTGCSGENFAEISEQLESISTEETMETIEIVNPFEYEDEDEVSEDFTTLNFGWGVNAADVNSLTYKNGRLAVPIKVTNKGQMFDIGVFVFVNGIIQPYTTDLTEEKKYIQGVEIPENKEVVYEIYIDNIELPDETAKNELAVLSVVNPDYSPEPGEYMGDNHTAAGLWPFDFNMDDAPRQSDVKIVSDYKSSVFTDEEKVRFWINEKDTNSSVQFFLCPENSESSPDWRYAVSESGEQNMRLYAYSMNLGSCDYRVSFYKNNEPISFGNGFDYLDITCKDNFMSTAEINLSGINENDFVYCIAVPLNADRGVKKTTTILFCDESNIPETSNEFGMFAPSTSEVIIDPNSDYKEVTPNQIAGNMRNSAGLK